MPYLKSKRFSNVLGNRGGLWCQWARSNIIRIEGYLSSPHLCVMRYSVGRSSFIGVTSRNTSYCRNQKFNLYNGQKGLPFQRVLLPSSCSARHSIAISILLAYVLFTHEVLPLLSLKPGIIIWHLLSIWLAVARPVLSLYQPKSLSASFRTNSSFRYGIFENRLAIPLKNVPTHIDMNCFFHTFV